MKFLGWLFGNSMAEVEAARAHHARAMAADAQFRLESQRRWLTINAMIAEGWRPYIRQSIEHQAVLGRGLVDDYPSSYDQIEMCRLGQIETWVRARSDNINPQMNVVDLWWRPYQGEIAPVDGGELKAEEPLALPPPEKQGDAS